MQDTTKPTDNNRAPCVVCGTPVPLRDIRDKRTGKPVYCGRVHKELARFGTRYRGTNAGPLSRPTTEQLMDKTKWPSV